MTKAERGVKRRCLNCSTSFFDLNRKPILCPKCDVAFQVVEIAHSPPRRTPLRPAAIDRPGPDRLAPAELVLSVGEEGGVASAIPPTEEDEEIEEIKEVV